MRAIPLVVAALLLPIVARAEPPDVKPVVLGEFDFRIHAAERIEGEDGFGVTRLRLGAMADFVSWCTVIAQAEWAREKPVLLEAFASIKPAPAWELEIGASKTPLF